MFNQNVWNMKWNFRLCSARQTFELIKFVFHGEWNWVLVLLVFYWCYSIFEWMEASQIIYRFIFINFWTCSGPLIRVLSVGPLFSFSILLLFSPHIYTQCTARSNNMYLPRNLYTFEIWMGRKEINPYSCGIQYKTG